MDATQKNSYASFMRPRAVAGALVRGAMFLAWCLLFVPGASAEKSVTLAWDKSPTPTVVGYTVQYGTNSGQYSEFLLLGDESTAQVTDLLEGVTYYFVVTAHTEEGLESDPSNELAYTVPGGNVTYLPPTLNEIDDVIVDEDSGLQRVDLLGLGTGTTGSNVIITAVSSNPNLVPDPVVTISNDGVPGFITFAPAKDAFGSATITVTVNNQQPINNIIARTFTVTIYSVNDAPTLDTIADVTIESGAGPQLITLSGIGSGADNEAQLLSISAESSEPEIIPAPQVIYSSPDGARTLHIDPVPNTNGSSIITVTLSDGQQSVVRTFRVNVTHTEVTYYIEAESGSVQYPMVVAASANASSGRYVYAGENEAGAVAFNLNAAVAGNYVVWCRILSVSSSSDSFYISLDGGPEVIYSTAQSIWSKTWQWTRINSTNSSDALLFPLGQGPHTISFRAREQSTMLDSLYVTNDRDFVPVHLTMAKSVNEPHTVDLIFQTAAGYRYAIDTTSDLTNWSTIWSVSTNIPLAQVIKYQAASDSDPMRFYRVRVNP